MNKGFVRAIVFILWNINTVIGYKIFYMKESGCCSSSSVEINVGSLSRNSSGILKSSTSSIYELGLNCTVYLRPPRFHGIVISIRSIDLEPQAEDFENCVNYLQLSPIEHRESMKICGYIKDKLEYQSHSSWGGMRISLHTSNSTSQKRASFELTFTAVRNGKEGFCTKGERRCRNHNCIWKGLICDGHNNCGDLSDEIDKYVAKCAGMSAGESLAVILITIIGSFILIFIAAYLRGPKLTEQIERLSRSNGENNPPEAESQPDFDPTARITIPSANRIRTNYGSISQFLSSCDFSDMIYPDPPPRYEEIPSISRGPLSAPPSYSAITHLPILQTSDDNLEFPANALHGYENDLDVPETLSPESTDNTKVLISSSQKSVIIPAISFDSTQVPETLPGSSEATSGIPSNSSRTTEEPSQFSSQSSFFHPTIIESSIVDSNPPDLTLK